MLRFDKRRIKRILLLLLLVVLWNQLSLYL